MKHGFASILSMSIVAALVTAGPASGESKHGKVTFSKDVAPILQANCQICHRPGQIGPMSFLTYDLVRPWARSIKQVVAARQMPPWLAHPESRKMKGDLNLSQEEIDTIVAWVDQGAKEGNRIELPAPAVFTTFEGGWRLKKPDIVLQPAERFRVTKDMEDHYHCFSIELGLEEEAWLKAAEFKAGNPKVVHHFILFEDTLGRFAEVDAATPEPGCECSNMDKVLFGARILEMWAPGNVRPLPPEGVARPMGAHKNLILQVHYHNVTGQDEWDQSQFALHLAHPEETIMKETQGWLVSANVLNIKAGDPNSEHEAIRVADRDMTLYTTGVHMHLRGKDMRLTAQRPGEELETLIWVPRWDFNWQYTYEFEEPFKAPKGTVFRMVSHHDNTENNPNNPIIPPVDIHWGLGSKDEMSFSGFGFTYDDEALNITPKLPKHHGGIGYAGGDD